MAPWVLTLTASLSIFTILAVRPCGTHDPPCQERREDKEGSKIIGRESTYRGILVSKRWNWGSSTLPCCSMAATYPLALTKYEWILVSVKILGSCDQQDRRRPVVMGSLQERSASMFMCMRNPKSFSSCGSDHRAIFFENHFGAEVEACLLFRNTARGYR